MAPIRRQFFCTAALAAACIGGSTSSDAGRAPHGVPAASRDGVYAVEILTLRGACDRVSYFTVSIAGGRVASPAEGLVQTWGGVSASGAVSLAFRGGADVATAAGRVNGRIGSGTWSSPTMRCAGSWRAARRG
jgi:hypothetical protein